MIIHPAIAKSYPKLNPQQKAIIQHPDGPLLVIAGPGSGKTFSLVLRTINLLLNHKAAPKEVVLCTFTEKAAYELRDRISAAAQRVDYSGNLSELRVSTIHGLCNGIVMDHRHHTKLGNNYEVLDELTQWLFIFDHFRKIIGEEANGKFLGRWSTKWTAIEGVSEYFSKITEELVSGTRLVEEGDDFLQLLGASYQRYVDCLYENNRIDFAHQQKIVLDLMEEAGLALAITKNIKYVMVDEYQDTNHIQEQLLLKLVEHNKNICVVGDEDQSLYRFRGATVRNILEFDSKFEKCSTVKLTTNYRSHKRIIEAYDKWMASSDWSNKGGRAFRFEKSIEPFEDEKHPDYPAVFAIWGKGPRDEGERFADLVKFLKESEVIKDYNQVALLLRSVRYEHSGHYLDALEAKGIPAFCPRARGYFDNDEVRYMVGCLALIFGYHGDGRGSLAGRSLQELAKYVDSCIVVLARQWPQPHPLAKALQGFAHDISRLTDRESLDLRPADCLYRLLAFEPFQSFMKNENRARNIAIFSQLLNVFQNYYDYSVVTHKNREYLRYHLFNSFLRLLHEGGINEYEDPDQPFPKGHVQVMTIHQAKGLEFSVVAVGSLSKRSSTQKRVDFDLQPFYNRPPFEPEDRITHFDRMRLHYVAFSRPERVLVLTAHEQPKDHFNPIWQGLPQWPYVKKDLLEAQDFDPKERMPVKRTFSFTGDLKLYETCPRQYQFYREYDFTPSRSAVIFFGLLVHQTIEEIHRLVMDGKLSELDGPRVRGLFERTYRFLAMSDVRPIGKAAKEAAFQQVINYFTQNQEEMKRVVETEVSISVEMDKYILMGKIDLLMGADDKLELLDFKTAPKPKDSPDLITTYHRQLCTYANILEKHRGRRPERLFLYWTSEKLKRDALMEFPYDRDMVQEADRYFDAVIRKIQTKAFVVAKVPEAAICKECDFSRYCASDGLFKQIY